MEDGAFPSFLETAPIFFVSTHGAYQLKEYNRPFLVPENTIIIDTVDIGEACLTYIDKPLWNLMQGTNRAKLISYMKGIPDLTDSVKDQENYLRIFNNIHIYFPGDPIYSRVLSIGPTKRNEYKNMGFFKFKVGDPANTFNNSRNVFKQSGNTTKILRSLERELVLHGEKLINYEYMLQSRDKELTDSRERIFIFSSCGVTWSGTKEQKEAVQQSQEYARLKFMAMRTESDRFGRAFVPKAPLAPFVPFGRGWAKVPKGIRGELPEEFAPGALKANTNSNDEGVYFEPVSMASLEPGTKKSSKRVVSALGEQLFYQKPGSAEFLSLHQDDGTLFYTPAQVNTMKRRLPGIQLYRLVKGAFVPLKKGGTRRRKRGLK
ncbi:MAG: hypothetical protein WCG14_08310 [Chlamydiia bacterium]